MCNNCGCNTCKTELKGPLLTEDRIEGLISNNLQYHIDRNIPLTEKTPGISSDEHLSIIKEARKLYSRDALDLCEEDEVLMGTHLGEFDLYENEIVPLDLPMLEDEEKGQSPQLVSKENPTGETKGLDSETMSKILMKIMQSIEEIDVTKSGKLNESSINISQVNKSYYIYIKEGDKVRKKHFKFIT